MKHKLLATLGLAFIFTLPLCALTACGDKDDNPAGDSGQESPAQVISNHKHEYDEREICTICGYTENGTEGLEYGYISELFYYVRSIGTATETDIIIPTVHDDGSNGMHYVQFIDSDAFANNTNIKSVTIGYGVQSIEIAAFYGCNNLTCVTLPKSITGIGQETFYNCSALTSINIPDSVTFIGPSAFSGCSKLTSFTIPDGVNFIWENTFSGCENLIQTENGIQYVDKWAIGCNKSVTSVSLRNNTVGIASMTFSGCKELMHINMRSSVKSIGDFAFSGCSSLTSIIIPNSVIYIEYSAFSGCSGLTNITIENNVTRIDTWAFRGCSELTDINFLGTIEEWYNIEKNHEWDISLGNYTIHCTNGDIEKEI